MIEAEIEAHWTLQRQIYLQEEVKALEKTLLALGSDDTGATESLLLVYETELEDLKHSFKDRAPRLWELEGGMPVGTLERAFRTCRNNPDWYLCRFLRQDCAGRGGCCARGCGCCDNKNRGHCTTACGCCIRTHGRSGDLEDGDLDLRDMHGMSIDVTTNAAYSRRFLCAYIWGLSFVDELGLTNYWCRWRYMI